MVNNFVCLVPICLYIVKYFFKGLGFLSMLLEAIEEIDYRGRGARKKGLTYDKVYLHTLEVLLCICTTVLGSAFLFNFFAHGSTPRNWTTIPLRMGSRRYNVQLLRYGSYITCAFLHFLCIALEGNYDDYNVKGLMIVSLLHLTSFFHPMVEAMLTVAAEIPVPTDKFPTGRAFEVVQMGLTFGTLFAFFDLKDVPVGLLIYTLGLTVLYDTKYLVEEPLGRNLLDLRFTLFIGNIIVILPSVLPTVMAMRGPPRYDPWILVSDMISCSLPVCQYIGFSNFCALHLRRYGENLGRKMTRNVLQASNRGQGFESYLGPICFASWTLLICAIMVL